MKKLSGSFQEDLSFGCQLCLSPREGFSKRVLRKLQKKLKLDRKSFVNWLLKLTPDFIPWQVSDNGGLKDALGRREA